jgi:hypothetical protein
VLRAGAVALLSGGLVLLGRWSGVLTGWPALLLTVVGLLVVPTSTQPARRILWTGCLVGGWLPMLWWWPLPTAGLGRVAWLLALLVGGLAGWVAAGPVRGRLGRLLPKPALVDAAVPAVAGLGAWVLQPWLMVRTPLQAFAVLATNRDAAVHFAITLAIRRGDAAVPALGPAPDGTAWLGGNYPQPFHILAAATAELLHGPSSGGPGDELVRHAQAVAALVIAGVVVVIAGIVALPALRRRPALGLTAAGTAAGALLLGPGAAAVLRGHWPFLLTVVAALAATLAGLQTGPRWRPLPVAAVTGATVAVAHGWAMLGCVAVPGALLACVPVTRRGWTRRRWPSSRVETVIVVAVLVAGVLAALDVLTWLQVQDAVTLASAVGWVQVESPSMLALVLGGSVVGSALLYRRRPLGLVERRLALAVGVPVCGVVAATGLLVAEIRTTGVVGYYGAKLLVGVFLVVLVLGATVLAHLLARAVPPARTGPRSPRIVALGRVLGPVAGVVAVLLWVPSGGGVHVRDGALRNLHAPPPEAVGLMRAAPLQQQQPFGTVLFLSGSSLTQDRNAYGEFFADAWFTALTGTASQGRFTVVQGAVPGTWEPKLHPAALVSWLQADPRRQVVVDPRGLDVVRRWVTDAGLAGRVVTP